MSLFRPWAKLAQTNWQGQWSLFENRRGSTHFLPSNSTWPCWKEKRLKTGALKLHTDLWRITVGAVFTRRHPLSPIRRIECLGPEYLTVRIEAGVVNALVAHELWDIAMPLRAVLPRADLDWVSEWEPCTLNCRKTTSWNEAHTWTARAYRRYQHPHFTAHWARC